VYTGKTGEDDFANHLSAVVEKIKQDEKFRSVYLSMNLHDFDIREEGKEEGFQQGAQQKAEETAINMLKKNKYTVDEIAEVTELAAEKVLELQKAVLVKV
jgi:hypothetical protein